MKTLIITIALMLAFSVTANAQQTQKTQHFGRLTTKKIMRHYALAKCGKLVLERQIRTEAVIDARHR